MLERNPIHAASLTGATRARRAAVAVFAAALLTWLVAAPAAADHRHTRRHHTACSHVGHGHHHAPHPVRLVFGLPHLLVHIVDADRHDRHARKHHRKHHRKHRAARHHAHH